MEIVLCNPATTKDKKAIYDTDYPNFGLLYIAGYLRKYYGDVNIHYVEGNYSLEQHMEIIGRIRPDLYGISFTSLTSPLAYMTIDKVKAKYPSLPVICGGAHPTAIPEGVLSKSKADVCVIGEGETAMLELVKHFRDGNGIPEGVKGIAYRKNGEIVRTPKRSLIPSLDTIPFPAWELIDFNKYHGLKVRMNKPPAAVVFTRGCPYNCCYCSNPVWKNTTPWVRKRSPSNIASEIGYLYNRGVREVFVASDEFNIGLKWNLEVCKGIEKLRLKDLTFQCNLTANKVTDELAEALKSINCWMVRFGFESGNQRVLDGIEKKITLEQIIDSCTMLKKHNIKVYGYFMLYQVWEKDGRLCWETPQEVENTIRFFRMLHKKKLVDYISWTIASPLPGSKLYDVAVRHNLLGKDSMGKSVFEFGMSLPGVSQKTLRKHRRKGLFFESYYAFTSGRIEWLSWRRILLRIKYVLLPWL